MPWAQDRKNPQSKPRPVKAKNSGTNAIQTRALISQVGNESTSKRDERGQSQARLIDLNFRPQINPVLWKTAEPPLLSHDVYRLILKWEDSDFECPIKHCLVFIITIIAF